MTADDRPVFSHSNFFQPFSTFSTFSTLTWKCSARRGFVNRLIRDDKQEGERRVNNFFGSFPVTLVKRCIITPLHHVELAIRATHRAAHILASHHQHTTIHDVNQKWSNDLQEVMVMTAATNRKSHSSIIAFVHHTLSNHSRSVKGTSVFRPPTCYISLIIVNQAQLVVVVVVVVEGVQRFQK